MDENLKTEVSQRAIKYLDAIEKGVTQGGEFLTEQVTEISREIVNWEIARHSLAIGVVIALLITLHVSRYLLIRSLGPYPKEPEPGTSFADLKKTQEFHSGVVLGSGIGAFLVSGLLCIPLCINAALLCKPVFAPRLVVLDHVKSLTR